MAIFARESWHNYLQAWFANWFVPSKDEVHWYEVYQDEPFNCSYIVHAQIELLIMNHFDQYVELLIYINFDEEEYFKFIHKWA